MKTYHKIYFGDNYNVSLEPNSIDLIVTSPPYPMIDIWDDSLLDKDDIDLFLKAPYTACDTLCEDLIGIFNTSVYKRAIKDGSIVCINMGDATRSISKKFALYPNHAFVINKMLSYGYTQLPTIIWKKQSNSPNKFMGSGMLPSCAYVTMGHEYILVFRKGTNRVFEGEEKFTRRESAYFWEERNIWFSDIWEGVRGISQKLKDPNIGRAISARFPITLPQRLIRMFTSKGDTVLDPFIGTGTTTYAAIAEGRNSLGIELDKGFRRHILDKNRINNLVGFSRRTTKRRILDHIKFILDYKKEYKHTHNKYDFPVFTKQETDIRFDYPYDIKVIGNTIRCKYKEVKWPVTNKKLIKQIKEM